KIFRCSRAIHWVAAVDSDEGTFQNLSQCINSCFRAARITETSPSKVFEKFQCGYKKSTGHKRFPHKHAIVHLKTSHWYRRLVNQVQGTWCLESPE
ncbi:hypothetical protein X975_02226, partial [Stegodyphus mimosarum]